MVGGTQRSGTERVTLQTIADRLGVSRMTVSNAFSRPDQLSPALRDRILATAEGLGYSGPDPAARALARGTSGAIGVLLTDSLRYAFSDAVATRFLSGVAAEIGPLGVAMTLLSSPRSGTEAPTGNVAMDGAIVYSVDADSPALRWLRRRGIPLIFVDQKPEARISSVNVDDRSGARAAAQHLVDLGHRRIGILAEALRAPIHTVVSADVGSVHQVARERIAGWLDAFTPAGIEPIAVNQYNNTIDEAELAARLLLDVPQPPTAIICMSDLMAAGVLNVAGEFGLSVPGQLSVVGFDDQPLATSSRPLLTTVRQPVDEKARIAAQALLATVEAVQAGREPRIKHAMLPTELVVRDSTAAPG
jgi:DNA-binding LacI/PurR family transcriptional regulator